MIDMEASEQFNAAVRAFLRRVESDDEGLD
jgi:hypothetical protein